MRLIQRCIAVLLAVQLAWPAMPAAAAAPDAVSEMAPRHQARPAYRSNELQGDERILHALNRFTFGPRAGDLEQVRAIGLDRWFEQQLHPANLDFTDLNTRLAQYPAMQWSTQDLVYRLPSNAIIRQAMNGKFDIPDHGILHTVYVNQIERLTAKKQAKEQNPIASMAQPNAPAESATMNALAELAGDENAQTAAPTMKEPTAPSMQSASGQMNPANQPGPAAPTISDDEINDVMALRPDQRVMRLAAMQQPELDAFLKSMKPRLRQQFAADMTPDQKQTVAALENPERLVAEELVAQRLTRDIDSPAQLQEVMTDFWFNHFNVYLRKNETMPYELVSYERDVIRPRALGKFEDLLEATAHSPAMLFYLDNAESIGPESLAAERAKVAADRRPANAKKSREGLNENYARELMELHTLGVNGGYTQADVTQVARILTGWTIDHPQRGGGFQFDPRRHEPGAKKALGQKFKEHGELEGRELLHYLASRPATAQFLSRKLAIRFVSDDPPQSLIDRLARSYQKTDGDIAAVLTTLFHSPEFWSTTTYRAKVKTPLEFVVSAVRASDADISNLRPIAEAMRQMGMPVYGCVPPTGYSWQASAWVSTGALVDRMNFALNLAANRLQGVAVHWTQPTRDTDTLMPSPAEDEKQLESTLVAGTVADTTRTAVLQQYAAQTTDSVNQQAKRPAAYLARPGVVNAGLTSRERQDQVLAGLLLGSPEFQRR